MLLTSVIILCLGLCVTATTTADEKPKETVPRNDTFGFNQLIHDLGFEEAQKKILWNVLRGKPKVKKMLDITLVAWQYVHDEMNNLKEINTLELLIPGEDAFVESENDDQPDYGNDYQAFLNQIEKVHKLYRKLKTADDVDTKYFEELYDEDKNEVYQVVVGHDEVYASWMGSNSIYNKTIRNAKPEDIEAFINGQKQKHTYDVSVLRYDEDGSFIPETSHIVPTLTVTVTSIQDDASVDIVDEVASVVADVSAKFLTGEITDQLFDYLSKKIPKYSWGIIEDPDSYYVARDIGLYVSYDMFDLESRSDYYIYGIEK